jgi:hypothetical protein
MAASRASSVVPPSMRLLCISTFSPLPSRLSTWQHMKHSRDKHQWLPALTRLVTCHDIYDKKTPLR